MAQGPKAKYDPLEAAKLGTDSAAPAASAPITTPQPSPAKAKDFDVSDVKPAARRPRFRLLKDKRVSIRGQMCDWKAGRIVDSAGYDIDNVKSQGAELELIEE